MIEIVTCILVHLSASHCVFVVLTKFAFGVFVSIAPLLSLSRGWHCTGRAEAEIITVSPSVTDTSTPGLDWKLWVGRCETWKCVDLISGLLLAFFCCLLSLYSPFQETESVQFRLSHSVLKLSCVNSCEKGS